MASPAKRALLRLRRSISWAERWETASQPRKCIGVCVYSKTKRSALVRCAHSARHQSLYLCCRQYQSAKSSTMFEKTWKLASRSFALVLLTHDEWFRLKNRPSELEWSSVDAQRSPSWKDHQEDFPRWAPNKVPLKWLWAWSKVRILTT